MRDKRIGISLSPQGLERLNELKTILGTKNQSEAVDIAIQMAIALKTDPIASLAAAGVHFDSAITIDLADGKVVVKAYQPKGMEVE